MGVSRALSAVAGKKSDTIPALTTKVIEEVPLVSFKTVKYFVHFSNLANNITKGMEVTVKKSGASVKSVVSNRIGIGIDLAVNPIVNGVNLDMSIINNEAFDIQMSFAKLTI